MSRFNLIFAGEIAHDFEPDAVKQNFKSYFHLSDVQVKYIFSGKEIILKKNLTQEQALNYALKIDEIGGVTYFEPVNDVKLPEGVTEDRRKDQRRKRADRRKIFRAGISADRRVHCDRRKNK